MWYWRFLFPLAITIPPNAPFSFIYHLELLQWVHLGRKCQGNQSHPTAIVIKISFTFSSDVSELESWLTEGSTRSSVEDQEWWSYNINRRCI
jgi:hypothetical protein